MRNTLNITNKPIPDNYWGFIYKTIFPNGKIYIGQTTLRSHQNYLGSGTKVHSFIKSKGTIGIKREIMRFCNDQLSLDKWEQIYILKFKSINCAIGYNIIRGAAMKFNPMKNPESVEKLRKYVIENHPMRGKKNSDEYKRNMSEILKRREFSGKNNPMFEKEPHNLNKICINNGLKNKFINDHEQIPEGYSRGMIFKSKLNI